jgi:glycosyltransferase involved in cell wall biosynthesis
MHILVLNYEYPPIGGGGGFVTRDLAEQWAEKGHRVTVITSKYSGLKKYEIVNGVEVMRVPVLLRNKAQVASHASMLSYVPSAILKAILTARSRTYNVINTHFAVPSGHWSDGVRLLRIPNILSIHGGDIFAEQITLAA